MHLIQKKVAPGNYHREWGRNPIALDFCQIKTDQKIVVARAVLGPSMFSWNLPTPERQWENQETALIQKILGLCFHSYGRPRITGCLSEPMTNNDPCLVWAAIMKCVCVWSGME